MASEVCGFGDVGDAESDGPMNAICSVDSPDWN